MADDSIPNPGDAVDHAPPLFSSILDAIGGTPLVALDRLTAAHGLSGRILAKLDYLNPGFTKKDRAALGIITRAKADGILKPGQTVVELTSGNMGAGLAIVCSILGHPFIAVMSKGNSRERAVMMEAFGADVVLVDQAPGSKPGQVSGDDLAIVEEEARRITKSRQAFRADQFNHPGNWLSHFHGTGPEIWQQCAGEVDGFVDFVGSAGTFAGVGRFLKKHNPSAQCWLAEPEGAAPLSGKPVTQPGHPIQGGGYSLDHLAFLDGFEPDGFLQVTGEEATRTTRDLARLEGIFAGYSAGANAAAAIQLLQGTMQGKAIAVVMCDSGLKYLSTSLWESKG